MKKLLLVAITGLCITTMSCTDTTNCPAFDGSTLYTWFPYQEGDIYYFSGSNGDMDTLVIGTMQKTDAYTVTQSRSPFKHAKEYCEISGTVTSAKDNAATPHPGWINMYVRHHISGNDQLDNNFMALSFDYSKNEGGVYVQFNATNELATLFNSGMFDLTTYDHADLNNRSYNHVRLIEPNTEPYRSLCKMDKLYIARDMGVIGYRTYPDLVEYWLQ